MRNEAFSPGAGRNDGFNAALLKISSQAVGVVGLVSNQSFDRSSSRQQLLRHHHVMDIARRDQQNPRLAGEGPPFPPAAERCALTWELSIEAAPITLVLPVTALNMASQMPWRLHRLNRL